MTKTVNQPESLNSAPAIDQDELIEDKADVVRMDLRKFNKTRAKISIAAKAITSITLIDSQAGADKMMLLLKEASGVGTLVDDKRRELGDPYRLEVIRINDYVKNLVKPLEPAIKHGKGLILAFHARQRTDARHAQLIATGLEWHPDGVKHSHGVLVPVYLDRQTDSFVYRVDVETSTDETWKMILFNIETKRAEKKVEELRQLEQEKAGADFFGDDEAVAEAEKKIAQATAPTAPFFTPTAAPKPSGLTKRWTHALTELSLVPREYLQLDEKKVKEAIAAGTRVIPGIRIYQDESITIR